MDELNDKDTPYAGLDPDRILSAVESLGYRCDGRLLALNSYENRVYQIGIEDAEPVVAKFYRPGRWSNAAILEEHAFSQELAEGELPVVCPLLLDETTLHEFQGYRFALFPRCGGHAPELTDERTLNQMGRLLGRLHAIGEVSDFKHRQTLTVAAHGDEAVASLLAGEWLPDPLRLPFERICSDLLAEVRRVWARGEGAPAIRLHGDFHPGNILWRNEGAHLVDLDDSLMGPPMQDLWMLLSGEREECARQIRWLLEGYRMFNRFDLRQLHLIEALRSLRVLHYNAWLARRWHDPAFPRAFPWFGELRHWEGVIEQLKEQLFALQEPVLEPEHLWL